MAIGGVAATVAAVLAFVDAAWSRAALAAELAILVVGAYLLLSRKIERVRVSLAPLKENGRRTATELKRARVDIAKVRQSVSKLQVAQDRKIASAVKQINDSFAAQLAHEAIGIKSVIKDTEIESGLAALNRYTSMAEKQADAEGSAGGA